ncbi:hypothetical protein BDU57DRAFT_523498 [Ampelomyces quisqualis]|uniref:MYND-type domain-containing protein n=1 Tax=Ampelomyces quisqualis TaxID=50730 RepID=A0A6A5QCB1_AMPQU|nr:hypothetical protein BDU57DRAFT_523498 [Ampelomyces quisqualis]
MPPRSVCLNVFTSSLGEAVRDDGAAPPTRHPIMERRDSAQSDVTRRSSAGSFASSAPAQTPFPPPPLPAFHRADMFSSLRTMASTESLNFSMHSKPCSTCSGGPAKRRCSRCKAAYYCDRNCQKSDWKTHRNACEPAAQEDSAPATPNVSNPASPTNEG